MKAKLLFIALLGCNLTFAQSNQNQAVGGVQGFFSSPVGLGPQLGAEIFRFRTGFVSQLDAGTGFGFSNDRWFSIGRVPTGTQSVYGIRFQDRNRAVTFGYQNTNVPNPSPRIQWIDTGGTNSTPLEFRYASSFTSTNSTLVASMNSDGSTTFGDPTIITSSTRVVINNNADIGFKIESLTQTHGNKTGFVVNQPLGTNNNTGGEINVGQTSVTARGLSVNAFTSNVVTGITANATDGAESTIGVSGVATPSSSTFGFAAGIFGRAENVNGQQWAGFFEGRVFAQAYFRPQIPMPGNPGNPLDPGLEPIDPNIRTRFLGQRLMQVTSRTYNSKKDTEVNAAANIQYGFAADELEKVFPELVKTINQPVFDKSGKLTNTIAVKAIDYDGMIPILVSTVQELNNKIEELEKALETADSKADRGLPTNSNSGIKGVFLNQNVPNPFSDRTTIRYQLPEGTSKASLIIFDMNGGIKKEFALTENKSEITVTASQIGKGLFIYSLVQNGQILETKKMIIQ
jgi:hypothetical protein